MPYETPQVEAKLNKSVSTAVEQGMPLSTKLYGARGETLGDVVGAEESPVLNASELPKTDPLYEEATLDTSSFLSGGEYSTSDFVTDDINTRPVINKASNVSIAAKTAALTDEANAIPTYQLASAELDTGGKSDVVGDMLDKVREKTYRESSNALANILTDPTLTDEQKQEAMDAYHNFKLDNFSISEAVMAESLVAASEGETIEQETARLSLADAIDEVNQVKREQQALLNAQVASSDTETSKAFRDITEYLIPFMEAKQTKGITEALNLDEGRGFFSLMSFYGDNKAAVRDALAKMPPAQRMGVAEKIVEAINANSSIVMPDVNDYARVQMLRTVLEEGYYEDGDQMMDNIIGAMDMFTGVGTPVTKAAKATTLGRVVGAAGKASMESAMRSARRMAVRSKVQPTTLSQLYKDTNPAKAKNLHEAVAVDETGEVAEATYGTNKTEAIANDLMPEVADVEGHVKNKVGTPESINDQKLTPSPELSDFVDADGAIHYWKAEKRQMRAQVVNDFENAIGVRNRKEMNQIESLPDGVKVKAVYGPSQMGYTSASEALELTKVALRDYGITDGELTLLRRSGDTYVPTTLKEVEAMEAVYEVVKRKKVKGGAPTARVRKPNDFLIQVDHKYSFNPMDVTKWAEADVRRNLFDRIPLFAGKTQGSLARHVLDVASMLHPKLTMGANVVVDKAAGLEKVMLEKSKKFADGFTALANDRQEALWDYIKEANARGLDLNYNKLTADGFNKAEIDTLKNWREYWDNMYWLDNRDMGRTLRAQNFHSFVDTANDTHLFARPISRQAAGSTKMVYDQTTGAIRKVDVTEITELYKSGGTLAQLREPMKIGDDVAELVVAKNKAGASYLKAIRDSDQVLQYRKGYYSVHYKDPKFIIKQVKDSKGKVLYEKAVATAANTREADLMAKRLGDGHYVRGDIKGQRPTSYEGQDGMDIMQSRGRTSQRARGKRLEDATSDVSDISHNNILGPVDSMILSARSTSNRVATRDYIEATKARFVSQFGKFLKTDKWGRSVFPANIDQIEKRGGQFDKDIADARTTFEYIDYLEKGYINSLDEGYKAILNAIADAAGKAHWDKAEMGARELASGRGPTGFAKNLAFQTYLAVNPLRQLIVQGHQAVQLFAFNPKYMAKQVVRDGSLLLAAKVGVVPDAKMLKMAGRTKEEYESMVKAWNRSGMSAAVDKNSLINGSLTQLVEETRLKGAKTNILSRAVTASRKVGFDMGEEINIMTAWLAHRDDLIKKGMKVDAELEDLATANARNFTYNMSRAGDMPYNQNVLGMVLQFMQVPHKAMTTWTTNRAITGAQKARLIGLNALLYTAPPAAMYEWLGGALPEDPELRDAVVMGLEPYLFNKALSLATGTNTRIDFSGLSPFDIHGVQSFITELAVSDAGSIIAATPSGQLLFGNSPRITNAARQWVNWFHPSQHATPTEFSEVAKATASIYSGMSNYFKASYALEYGRKLSTSGNISDVNVTTAEAIAQLFGFQTMDEAQRAWIGNEKYQASKEFREDVKETYRQIKFNLANKGISSREADFVSKAVAEAFVVYGDNNTAARKIILDEIKKDVNKGDMTLYDGLLKQANWPDAKHTRTMVENIPDQDYKTKKQMLDSIDFINSYKDE